MKTPRETSPYNLLQEQLRDHPWRLLVAVIMLNQTSARQVKKVIWDFFLIWPDARYAAEADPEAMGEFIGTLGFKNRRSQTIIKMSKKYLEGFEDPLDLPGIGKYGADSYNLFVRNQLVLDVQDKELINYVTWARERYERDQRDELRGVRGGLPEGGGSPSEKDGSGGQEELSDGRVGRAECPKPA